MYIYIFLQINISEQGRTNRNNSTQFYLWGHLKERVYAEKIWNIEHLRQRIIEACNANTPGIIKREFLDWVKRLNLFIENNSGHIEQLL
jgi:hypothetical protein